MNIMKVLVLAILTIVKAETGKHGELDRRATQQEDIPSTINNATRVSIERKVKQADYMMTTETGGNVPEQQQQKSVAQRRGEWSRTHTDETTSNAIPSSTIMDEFMRTHHLKKDRDLPMQSITNTSTFKINGKVHSLEGFVPMSVFSAGATYMEDGEENSLPLLSTFMKKDEDGTIMLMTKGPGQNIRTVDITHPDGSITYMESIRDGVLATMLPESRDQDALDKFIMGDVAVNDSKSIKRSVGDSDGIKNSGNQVDNGFWSRHLMNTDATPTLIVDVIGKQERHLQSGCSSLRVIDVAIAYESTFCEAVGGADNANALVQQIVARTSSLYESNFCGKVQITYLGGYCDPSTDPYREGVNLGQSGCNGNGLLNFFGAYWENNMGSVPRDTAHLFAGAGFDSPVVGCAFTGSLCSSTSSYGVDLITFSSDGQLQSNLFAHELGHNAGSGHDTSTDGVDWIMEPSLNSGSNGFSDQSRTVIASFLDRSTCISIEPQNTGGDGGDISGTIQSQYDTSCMDLDVTTGIVIAYGCHGGLNQEWIYDEATRRIMTAYNPSYCLDWNQNTGTNNLIAYQCHTGSNQQWVWDGGQIRSQQDQNMCIDLYRDTREYHLYPCHDGSNQKFIVGDGFF